MNAYMYQAALLCEECATACEEELDREGNNPDCFPDGPYPNGGGEADCPQHCDHCGVFLENPLTSDGMAYVKSLFLISAQDGSVIKLSETAENVWAPFYGIELPD